MPARARRTHRLLALLAGGSLLVACSGSDADGAARAGDDAGVCTMLDESAAAAALGVDAQFDGSVDGVCDVRGVDGATVARLTALGPVADEELEARAGGPSEPADDLPPGTSGVWAPGTMPGSTRLVATMGGSGVEIDVVVDRGPAANRAVVLALARAVTIRAPGGKTTTTATGGPVDDWCAALSANRLRPVLGESASVVPTVPAGSCNVTSADSTLAVVVTVAQSDGAEADQVEEAAMSSLLEGRDAPWPRHDVDVGEAAVYLADPTQDGRVGTLLVLADERLWSLSIRVPEGLDQAIDVGVGVASILVG